MHELKMKESKTRNKVEKVKCERESPREENQRLLTYDITGFKNHMFRQIQERLYSSGEILQCRENRHRECAFPGSVLVPQSMWKSHAGLKLTL